MPTLDDSLRHFERTEANLDALDKILDEMDALVPEGIAFIGGSPEGRKHNDLRRRFDDLVAALPALGGHHLQAETLSLDDIAQTRLDADDIGEIDVLISLGQRQEEPREAVAEYRHRLAHLRRRLVAGQTEQLVAQVDELVKRLREQVTAERGSVADEPGWSDLREALGQIRRLHSGDLPGDAWISLVRHVGFAEVVDLEDIEERDWPAVRVELLQGPRREGEPLEVEVEDLATVVAARPTGPVSTELAWSNLEDSDFERLLFNLFGNTEGYSNPQWLTRTHAPDRGRDLSVERLLPDKLSASRHQRVMVQCKHWLSRSVALPDATVAIAAAEAAHPSFDVLIIATSGRFTADAIAAIEGHNTRQRLQVEMWPDSHLELLLAERGPLVEQAGLRGPAAPSA